MEVFATNSHSFRLYSGVIPATPPSASPSLGKAGIPITMAASETVKAQGSINRVV